MDRISEHSLYTISHSSSQVGGSAKSPRSKSPNKSYKPADIDGETSTALDKFRKANRLLNKELTDTKQALEKEKELTTSLKKQLESSKFNS
tara:strand:+ start:542 stop:814 length:273 start_codon:yes stop_codon:yes gene_type:complete